MYPDGKEGTSSETPANTCILEITLMFAVRTNIVKAIILRLLQSRRTVLTVTPNTTTF
jgi:hypothetical protein